MESKSAGSQSLARVVPLLLGVLGGIGMVIGVLTIVLGWVVLRPVIQKAQAKLDLSLSAAQQAVRISEQNVGTLASTLEIAGNSAEMLKLMPESLTAMRGTLIQSASMLEAAAQTMDKMESQVTGALLPKGEVGRNVQAARKSADQLRLNAGMMEQMQAVSVRIAEGAHGLSAQAARMQRDLPALRKLLRGSASQLDSTRASLSRPSLPWLAAGVSAFLGGFYLFLGAAFLALSVIYRRTSGIARLVRLDPVAYDTRRRAS